MKKIILSVFVWGLFVLNSFSQDSVFVRCYIDTVVFNKYIQIFAIPNQAPPVWENTNGNWLIERKIPVHAGSKGKIVVRYKGCADTAVYAGNYDIGTGNDSITFNINNCDTLCKAFRAKFGFAILDRQLTFSNLSSSSADLFWWSPVMYKTIGWKSQNSVSDLLTTKNPAYAYPANGTAEMWLLTTDTASGCSHAYYGKPGSVYKANTVYFKFSFDSAINNKPIQVYYTDPLSYSTVSKTVNTNTAGVAQLTIRPDTAFNPIYIKTTNCLGDSILLTGNYSANFDSIVFNKVNYCPPCAFYKADFSYTNTLCTVSFTNTSSPANTYSWTFGDAINNTSSLQNPSHRYNVGGIFNVKATVKLIARDTINGCTDSVTKNISFAHNGIDSVFVIGRFDTAISNVSVTITNNSFNPAYTTTVVTNSNGQFGALIPVKNQADNLDIGWTDCVGDPQTSFISFTHAADTPIKQFVYCVPCTYPKFGANFSIATVQRKTTFQNQSTTWANSFSWNFDDGTTSIDKSPSHTYSKDSVFTVRLIARNTQWGCADTVYKTVTTNTLLQGKVVLDSNKTATDTAMVWLIYYDSAKGSLTAVDSLVHNGSGVFTFTGVSPGKPYLIKAALGTNSKYYPRWMPTYSKNSLSWSTANYITASDTVLGDADTIRLIKGNFAGGPGFIGGLITQGANKTGDSLAAVEVQLYTAADVPVAVTYTDKNGQYSFANIAFGAYKVKVEILGKPSEEYLVTLTANDAMDSNGNFEVNTKNITLKKTSIGIQKLTTDQAYLGIYPNPASKFVTLNFEAAQDEDVIITLIDITGKVVKSLPQPVSLGTNIITVGLENLSKGIYTIVVNTPHTKYRGKVVVTD